MSSTGCDVRQLIAWIVSLLPVCFYVTLAIACGLHRRWISVAFSAASAFAFSVSEVMNRVVIISAVVLAQQRTNAARQLNEITWETRHGASPPCATPQVDLLATDRNCNLVTAQQCEGDRIFLSATESTVANPNVKAFVEDTSSSEQAESCFRASTNPLRSPRHAVRAVGAALQESSQLPATFSSTELEETFILSPPFSLADAFKKDTVAAICASRTIGQRSWKAYPTERRSVDANSSTFTKEMASLQKGHAQHSPLFVTRLPDPEPSPPDARPMFSLPTVVSLRFADTSMPSCTALTMLAVSLYTTMILSFITLAGSVVLEYDTHCLFLACPALGVPWLWTRLMPVRSAFHSTPEVFQSFHGRLVRVLTHWLFMLAIWVVSLGVFVAAFTLEIRLWSPYFIGDEATPSAIRVVSYIAPVQMTLFMGATFSNLMEVFGVSIEDDEGGVMVADKMLAAANFRGCLPPQQVSSALVPGQHAPDRRDQQLSFAGPDCFTGSPTTHAEGAVSEARDRASAQFNMLPASCVQMLSDDTCSTLSSIVQSSTSSIFIPRVYSMSCEKLSMNQSHLHDTNLNSNGGFSHPGSSQPTAIITSVPQLKTVTMLYVAYRDIYEEDAMPSTFIASDDRASIGANRKKQQTVLASFESMMEALADAREKGSADANAYMLTAYEDALCLVWGLIPFSSEPVLLAIEKAQQIMRAFKSRQSQPTSLGRAPKELVAAIVSAPHSLVGLIGSGSHRCIHFFNGLQHALGAQILHRGFAMYRRLPSLQASRGEQENSFHCILLDGKSWNSTASHVLARPCGFPCSRGVGADAKGTRRCHFPVDASSKSTNRQFGVIYSFLEVVHAKEEEWHLVVQRQEHLGSNFYFLSEAVQQLHQGNLNGARQVLKDAVRRTHSSDDADNIALANMLLEDLDRAVEDVPKNI